MTLSNKIRFGVAVLAGAVAVLYTFFALWALSPLNHYDEPKIYQMQLVDRWDESYTGGKGNNYHQAYKGAWKELESGKVITLSIDGRMMNSTPFGTIVPMEFKPSAIGLVERSDFLYVVFPGFWIAMICIFSVVGIIIWLFSWDEE